MKVTRIAALLLGALLIGGVGNTYPQQQKFNFGKHEYDSNCAVCHGLKGKGDGIYKPWLTKSSTDLTVLTKNNRGVFPFDRVYAIIDGRTPIEGHGTADMPIWGRHYAAEETYFDVPYDLESHVRTRILALAEYVSRLQKE